MPAATRSGVVHFTNTVTCHTLSALFTFTHVYSVISTHEKQQSYLDISHDIKKYPHDKVSLYDRKKEDAAGELKHLKKPHVEET